MSRAIQEPVLLARARAGDRQAYGELVGLHFARVYSLLHRTTGNHEDAEDLAQETFVRAWTALARFRESSSFSTWVTRIALHLATDHARARALRHSTPLGEHDPAQPESHSAAAQSHEAELAAATAHALDCLPPRLRLALVLRVLEGREYAEVAELTGVRPATARTQVMQARSLLTRALARWLPGGRA
ncbi:MAG: RNA polymerase sigma factor [Planctomycetes bacterium]|nr:RNA polymerase sigma factor [Planctomycetota bacterium]